MLEEERRGGEGRAEERRKGREGKEKVGREERGREGKEEVCMWYVIQTCPGLVPMLSPTMELEWE